MSRNLLRPRDIQRHHLTPKLAKIGSSSHIKGARHIAQRRRCRHKMSAKFIAKLCPAKAA
jgi:hypothetical protein